MGHVQPHDIHQSSVLGSVLGSQPSRVAIWAWGRVAGKVPREKGPGDVGLQLAEVEPALCPGGQVG